MSHPVIEGRAFSKMQGSKYYTHYPPLQLSLLSWLNLLQETIHISPVKSSSCYEMSLICSWSGIYSPFMAVMLNGCVLCLTGLSEMELGISQHVNLRNITATSKWAWWRLKSGAPRLFTQPFVQGEDQSKHQSSASLAFVRGIHRLPVNSPHKKGTVRRKMFPFDDIIMKNLITSMSSSIPGLKMLSFSKCARNSSFTMRSLFSKTA